jgi:hypothetical protein
MSDHCGSITEDGSAVCVVPLPGQASAFGCSSKEQDSQPIVLSGPEGKDEVKKYVLESKEATLFNNHQEKTMWKKFVAV